MRMQCGDSSVRTFGPGVHDEPTTKDRAAHILVVDDEPANVTALLRILHRAGFTGAHGTSQAHEVIDRVRDRVPDMILLDQRMPGLDGIQLLELLQPHLAGDGHVPVVFISGDGSSAVRRAALRAGATDFIAKPFDHVEVVLRIRNLLETRWLHQHQADLASELERRVAERTGQLEAAYREVYERLCRVSAYRDDATGAHTQRVGRVSRDIAIRLGIDAEHAALIGAAAELHDIGKIGVPDEILLKQGPLSDEERAVMREHALVGARTLAGSLSPLMQLAEQIARSHHERWDGGGYPDALVGEEIPLAARIVAVADVADALLHARPYRQAWTPERVRDAMQEGSGSHFDPRAVEAFLAVHAEGSPSDEQGSGATSRAEAARNDDARQETQ